MRRSLLKITTAVAALGFALASPALAEEGDIYLSAGAMVDVVGGKLVENPALVIRGGRIAAIGTAGELAVPDGAETIALDGMTLAPGFMDMHVHLSGDAGGNFFAGLSYSAPRQAIVAVKNARKTLMAGFTTVRDVGAGGYSVIAVRDGINAGDIDGPRIFAVGNAIGITGGHCDNNFMPPEMEASSGGAADGPWAIRAKVRKNIKYGANAIKVCATGGVFSKGTKVGVQQLTLDELKSAVAEAHLRGMTIAAHAHGTDGIKAAIVAGVDSIEHASFADDEAINLAKEFGTYFSMDIYNTEYTLANGEANGVPEENINKEKQVSKAQRDAFGRAVKAGVKMVFGSDAAIYPHGDNAKQFSRMVQFGMTPMQALQASTINAATLLKMENDIGALQEGFMADIVAVAGNPLDDISVTENVGFVMKGGQVVKSAN